MSLLRHTHDSVCPDYTTVTQNEKGRIVGISELLLRQHSCMSQLFPIWCSLLPLSWSTVCFLRQIACHFELNYHVNGLSGPRTNTAKCSQSWEDPGTLVGSARSRSLANYLSASALKESQNNRVRNDDNHQDQSLRCRTSFDSSICSLCSVWVVMYIAYLWDLILKQVLSSTSDLYLRLTLIPSWRLRLSSLTHTTRTQVIFVSCPLVHQVLGGLVCSAVPYVSK